VTGLDIWTGSCYNRAVIEGLLMSRLCIHVSRLSKRKCLLKGVAS